MGNCLVASKKKQEFVESKANVETLKNSYDINMKVLGSGSYGKVFLAVNKKDPSMKIAIKVIKKTGMSEDDLLGLKREVAIMQQVDHPNIVKYYETYDDKKYIYLCMELCSGGELFQKIIDENKPMTEKEVSH
jgi:calcium-dependent protein kinase